MAKFQYEQERDFTGPCIVAPTKLNRLVDIGVSRLEKLEGTVSLEVTTITKSGKKSLFDTLEAALNQDNSLKNPIRSIQIKGLIEGTAVFVVIYGIDSIYRKEHGCNLHVAGHDPSWVNETYAELEEQVERVLVKDVYSLLGKISSGGMFSILVGCIFAVLTAALTLTASIKNVGPREYLQKEQLLRLTEAFDNANTPEEKSEAVFQERQAVLSYAKNSLFKSDPVAGFLTSRRGLYLIIPLVAAFCCLVYVATTCSPPLVFLWGDWEEHFAKIIKRRSLIMIGGFLSFAVGVVSSLVATSISQ